MTVTAALSSPHRFAGLVLLGAAALAAAAALVPFAPAVPGSPDAGAIGFAMPRPEAAPGAYLAASPFDPARGPVDAAARLPEAAPAPVEAPAESRLVVSGILLDGSARKVMFAGSRQWQAAGSTVGSWTLAAIEPRRVTLRRGEALLVIDARDAFAR